MYNIQRSPNVLWREEVDALAEAHCGLERGDDVGEIGTAVLFSGGAMLSVNVLGSEIWKMCDGRDFEAIVNALLQEFDVAEDVLRADVQSFLSDLKQKGFITYAE